MRCWTVNLPCVSFSGEVGAFDDAAALLSEVGDAKDLEFIFNDANGGDARFAFQVFDALKGRVKSATVYRRVVSASFILACAADKIRIERNAIVHLHAPTVAVYGRQERILLAAEVLSELTERCIQTVSQRRKIKSKAVRQWYLDEQEHIFTAQEAVGVGLADVFFDAPPAVLKSPFADAFDGPSDDGKSAMLLELLQALGPIRTADPEKLRRGLFAWQSHAIQKA